MELESHLVHNLDSLLSHPTIKKQPKNSLLIPVGLLSNFTSLQGQPNLSTSKLGILVRTWGEMEHNFLGLICLSRISRDQGSSWLKSSLT